MIQQIEKNGKAKEPGKKGKPAKQAAKPKTWVVIDFPQSGETLLETRHYAVRIGASSGPVEISVNGSDWKACRENAGYFWFDWTDIPKGEHKLVARAQFADGNFKKSKITRCKAK